MYERPFSEPLRQALLHGVRAERPRGHRRRLLRPCRWPALQHGHGDPHARPCGVTAVSQTAGAETVLCGEAELPYALLGYVTDYANGVSAEATPVSELARLVAASTDAFAASLTPRCGQLAGAAPPAVGVHLRFG